MGQDRPPIVYYAFDLLRLNGKDLRSLAIEERKSKLATLLQKPPPAIRFSISFTEKISELLGRARDLSPEGLVAKRSGSKYDSKRTGAWIKIKLYHQQGFVIGGYTQPYLPATGRGLDRGLSAAEMKRCIWVKPMLVCQVKFTEWTRDDRLRQPVFLGIREEKSAGEVVR